MAYAVQGTTEQELNNALLEFFDPGQRVDLILGLPHGLSEDQLQMIADQIYDEGIDLEFAEMISTREWPHALKLRFTRPSREGYGIAILPIVAILGTLGVLGIGGFLGFKIGAVIDALAKYIIPVTLIGMAGLILTAYVLKPSEATVKGRGLEAAYRR